MAENSKDQTNDSPDTTSNQNRIKTFRSLVKKAVLLSKSESSLFDTIPDILFERILTKNFNDNIALAERVLLNRYGEIDQYDRPQLEQRKRNIRGLDKSVQKILDALTNNRKVLFLTDNDNDGSMAQSVFLEFYQALPEEKKNLIHRAYAQPIGSSRGLNIENVDVLMEFSGWDEDEDVLLVTADIGINNRVEQEKIEEKYPNMELIITDHHLPSPKHVIKENSRTNIFNPQFKPTDFFKKKNISGADTLAVLLREVLIVWKDEDPSIAVHTTIDSNGNEVEVDDFEKILFNISEIARWSNLLDYVDADIVDMPLRPYSIERALDLRSLLNVSNSMGTFVTLDFSEKDWEGIASSVPDLDVKSIREKVDRVKGLNLYAQKLLTMVLRFSDLQEMSKIDVKGFYDILSETLDDDMDFESANPNYIAQLRPHIFRFSAIDNKTPFVNEINEHMISLYEDLRRVEKEMVRQLQKIDMLDQIKNANSTIVYPKSDFLTRLFPRKLLNKIYNEENNGFFLTLDKTTRGEYSGSMRAIYPIDEILPDEEKLEDELGVDIEILGHSKAAGFKIIARPGQKVTRATLRKINSHISKSIQVLKQEEKTQSLPFLSIDFASVELVNRINKTVKAHLSNMNGLPVLLKLGEGGESDIHITDSKTSEQISLTNLVNMRRYGYQAIQTDLSGGAFVIPVEQLRSVVENKFNSYLKMSYMDDGVFIANQAVDASLVQNVVDFKGNRQEHDSLIEYYNTVYKDSHFIDLTRDDFFNSPYFKYNKYGQSEFEQWESSIIQLLDKTNQDVLAVIDTEGTGLGKAPKCFNIGGTNIKINPDSGQKMDKEEFLSRLCFDESGKSYILPTKSIDEMTQSEVDEDIHSNSWKIYRSTKDAHADRDVQYELDKKPEDAVVVTNFTYKKGEVFFNRQVEGFAFAFIVKDNDFAITKDFENLTGISQEMVKKIGTLTGEVDEKLTSHYSNMKNKDGTSSKIIFAAHNMPYDKGVISSNFHKFNDLMDEHVLCDTKNLARSAKLAYDDTPAASFKKVNGIPSKAYFYDSPYSEYSLSTFLDRALNNKGGVYPDTKGRYLLRYNEKTKEISLIDKKELNEVLLDVDLEELLIKKHTSSLPNNAVKYSVEKLSQRAMIRNILLYDHEKPKLVNLMDEEKDFEKPLQFFQDQYHFDTSLNENIVHFLSSQSQGPARPSTTMLQEVGQRFLSLNKDTQAKFHDGWIYEKVLSLYEPVINEGKIPQDAIEQINYHTDLPRPIIEKILSNTIAFEKNFGLTNALIHEQHNNIRQKSENGQGLSDTAYESILPNHLAIRKFYNPYNRTFEGAVDAVIDQNIIQSMTQLFTKRDHHDVAAADSFSMRQMLAFDRENKTSLIEKAQSMSKSGLYQVDGHQIQPVHFKLGTNILPPGSGIYGTPKQPLTNEQINDCSEKLTYIIINEQLRSATSLARNIFQGHSERLLNISKYNDKKSLEYKKDITNLFSSVMFQRKEAAIKELSKAMQELFEGRYPKLKSSVMNAIYDDPSLLVTATALQVTHHNINQKIKPLALSSDVVKNVSDFLDVLDDYIHGDGIIGSAAKTDKKQLRFGSSVRDDNFLPILDIRRDEPLKAVIKIAGPGFLGDYLLNKSNQSKPKVSISTSMPGFSPDNNTAPTTNDESDNIKPKKRVVKKNSM